MREPTTSYGWHWLQYTEAKVSVAPEVWKRTANGYWRRETSSLKAHTWEELFANGWRYLGPVAHWAANSPDPIARAARNIIWQRYDGAPPWRTPIPDAEWEAAVQQAREAAEATP